MAFLKDYTDQHDDNYPESYWRPVQVNLCKEDKTAHIVFYGFESEEKKGKRIIGQKTYGLSGAEYDEYFSTQDLIDSNPYAIAYAYSLAKKDTQNGTDENGEAIMESFFEGCEQV